MKPPCENHELVRWLDGEMTEAERVTFADRLKGDPVLAREAGELHSLSALLHRHLPVELSVPHADFFNSQIQMRIAQMESRSSRSKALLVQAAWSWLVQNFRQPWLAASALLILSVIVVAWPRLPSDDFSHSAILSSYTPDSRVHARAFNDIESGATVLLLEGLEALPANREVSGVDVKRTETSSELASTILLDLTEKLSQVVSRDSMNNPLTSSYKP